MFKAMRLLVVVACAAEVVCAQNPTIQDGKFQGRRAWVMSNGVIQVSVLAGGGHIGEFRLVSNDPLRNINPMRVPHYPTIDPNEYSPAKHDGLYGDGVARWLMSGYMGHLLCFPSYGPPSEDEAKAGLGSHGEAPIVEWKKMKIESTPEAVTLWYGADLSRTNFRVERAITLRRGARSIHVREWVENKTPYDRPINWMQHATFGPPFIEPGKTAMDVSATKGQVSAGRPGSLSLQPGSAVNWPQGTGPEGKPADLRMFQPKAQAGVYYTMRLDPGRKEQFFTMYHPSYRVLIGYVFPSEGNVWLADWQENHNIQARPWNGQVIARGIEFGSSPFDEGLRKSVERGSFLGAPAYRWIGGRQRLATEFIMVLAEIPNGFKGVRDLQVERGGAVITSN